MVAFSLILLLPAVFALAWIAWSRRPQGKAWFPYLRRVGILVAIGLFAAGPFLTPRKLGTNEAYNYSLALADAVTQFRAGEFPVLVGQSEFAFNGRIHPLRTAPYLPYLAGLLDAVTFRHLTFWSLQNLILALSLMAGGFSCYVLLRRATGASPNLCLALAAAYLLCPGVLAAAYGMDLYMTVMTVPYVPLVAAGTFRALQGNRSFATYLLLGFGLAICWWAHPPVAWWLSVATTLAHLSLVARRQLRPRELGAISAAALLSLTVAAFVFVSSLTVRTYGEMSAARAPEKIVEVIRGTFAATLKPVSARADGLGDFQLGHAYWAVLAVTLVVSFRRRRSTSGVLAGTVAALLAFTVPVPGLTAWLWDHLPTFALTLNGPWPMQRLYLVATGILVFAAAGAGPLPNLQRCPRFVRDAALLLMIGGALWTVHQAWRFLARGYSTRDTAEATAASHAPENLDLTVIAYALFPVPPYFVNGVMDPAMEMRVLRRGTAEELVSNWTPQEASEREVAAGPFTIGEGAGETFPLRPSLKLEPGLRYRLGLAFREPPLKGLLTITGPRTRRSYSLPQAGQPRGFGMMPGNNPALTLWTSGAEPEIVDLHLIGADFGRTTDRIWADFNLRTYDPEKLPIRLESLIPLRATIRTAEPGYLEVPRMFLDGYQATVNGQPARVQASPAQQVMTAVPAGESSVVIWYEGPRWLRPSFWLSLTAAIAVLAAAGLFALRPRWKSRAAALVTKTGRAARPLALPVAVALVLIGAGAWTWRTVSERRQEAGPLRLRVVLPRGETNRSQPLLTTGKPNAGAFIFVIYKDPTHIQVGVDLWGLHRAWITDPIETDYFAEHEFVISCTALYPPGHPKLKGLDPAQVEKLRNRVTVQMDGKTVLDVESSSLDSEREAVTILENRIQGSSTEPRFVGKLLEKEWLPVPKE